MADERNSDGYHVGYGRKIGDGSDEQNLQKVNALGQYTKGSTSPDSERTEEGRNDDGRPRREDFPNYMEYIKAVNEWRKAKQEPKPAPVVEPEPVPEPEPIHEPAVMDNELNLPRRKDFDPNNPTKGFEEINSERYYSSIGTPNSYKWSHNCQRCYACFELWCRGYDARAAAKLPDKEDTIFDMVRVGTEEEINASKELDDFVNKMKSRGRILSTMSDDEREKLNSLREKRGDLKSIKKEYSLFEDLQRELEDFLLNNKDVFGKRKENQSKIVYQRMLDKAKLGGEGSRYAISGQWRSWWSGNAIRSAHIWNIVYEGGKLWSYDAQDGSKKEFTKEKLDTMVCRTVEFARLDDKKIYPRYIDDFIMK